MAKTREVKVKIVDELAKGLKAAKLIVLSEIKGLSVNDSDKLRNLLRSEQVKHQVVKISLLKRALSKAGIRVGGLKVATQVAVSYSSDDTAGARILHQFAKTNQQLKPLAGYLSGSQLSEAEVKQLSTVPSRTELLGQLVSVLAGPARGMVTVLSGNLRGLVTVLSKATPKGS